MNGGGRLGGVVPAGSGPVDDATFGFAVDLVERSGVCGPLKAALDKTTGRPRAVSVESVFVGLLLLDRDGRPISAGRPVGHPAGLSVTAASHTHSVRRLVLSSRRGHFCR